MLDKSRFSLNRIIYPGLDLEGFFTLVQDLGLSKVELRNDLPGGKILDNSSPQDVKALADQYGIRVNLIAVTAAGGLVDFRLKILDAEKARLLLQESSDVPALLVANGEAVLTAPEDSTGQLLNSLVDDGNIFLMYPNVGSAIKPGMPVTVQFGEIRLEPIQAQ